MRGATVIVASTYLDGAENADQVLLLAGGRLLAAGSPDQVRAAMPGQIFERPARPGEVPAPDSRIWQRGAKIYRWAGEDNHLPEGESAPGVNPALGEDRPRIGEGETALASQTIDLELATIAMLLAHQSRGRDGSGIENRGNQSQGRDQSANRGTALIETAELTKDFGGFRALDGVSLSVRAGEIVGLVGGNGAGKSTLIRLILGLLAPESGQVRLLGQRPGRAARRKVGYVPQSLGLYGALSGGENLQFMRAIFGAQNRGGRKAREESEPGVGLESQKLIRDLPLGARRNWAVTCALSHGPKLLIFDEPTSGMDALSRAALWKTLRGAAASGVGILITTHYQEEARQSDRVLHLERGRLVG